MGRKLPLSRGIMPVLQLLRHRSRRRRPGSGYSGLSSASEPTRGWIPGSQALHRGYLAENNRRIAAMYISLANSSANGFRKWTDTHRPSDRGDDDPSEIVPATVTEPPRDDREVIEELPQDS